MTIEIAIPPHRKASSHHLSSIGQVSPHESNIDNEDENNGNVTEMRYRRERTTFKQLKYEQDYVEEKEYCDKYVFL